MCCETAQALLLLLVLVCCDTAQALLLLLVSVCCDTAQALVLLLVSVCCDTAQALVFLLVSVCCDTAQALVFLLVSVCCDTAQALVFLLVSVCCDTAQALVFLLVSVCCDTAQALVFLLVSVCCDTAQAKAQWTFNCSFGFKFYIHHLISAFTGMLPTNSNKPIHQIYQFTSWKPFSVNWKTLTVNNCHEVLLQCDHYNVVWSVITKSFYDGSNQSTDPILSKSCLAWSSLLRSNRPNGSTSVSTATSRR